MNDPVVVALYLPQYHPIPENDEWWEKGFTEWTNVTKARPLFPGHQQPNLPSDLGFYDLRVPETREAQASLASSYGVDAFCYYHYWFGNGRRILERPFTEVLQSGKPDFPFMLCWANQTWSGVWHGLDSRVLIEQTYPGSADEEAHFAALLPAFRDHRHLRVEGKPVFMLYRPMEIPDLNRWASCWKSMACSAGLDGLYLICAHEDPNWSPRDYGFDAFVNMRNIPKRRQWFPWSMPKKKIAGKLMDLLGIPTVMDARKMVNYFVPSHASDDAIPCLLPNWDNTPRSGKRGVVLRHSSPQLFEQQLRIALERTQARHGQDRYIFIKSWNEWAEGNCLEPGRLWGHDYLRSIQRSRALYRPLTSYGD